jgi:hypothetical protein
MQKDSIPAALVFALALAAPPLAVTAAVEQDSAPPPPMDLQMSDSLDESAPPPAQETLPMSDSLGESEPPAQAAPTGSGAPGAEADAGAGKEPPAKQRVPYMTDAQRRQVVEETRNEVLDTARKENWAQPDALPAWVRRTTIEGELLNRAEAHLYDKGNNAQFINFDQANRNGPVNITPPPAGTPLTLPILNTTEDRVLPRLRAKLGLNYAASDALSVRMRISTGNTVNPASNNQTLGSGFNKLSLVLDRAYARYEPSRSFGVDVGRTPNPFATGTDLLWDRDLSFDGAGLRYRYLFSDSQSVGATVGAYSVENTDPNYPGNSLNKESSRDKWLLGVQFDLRTYLFRDQLLRTAIGYFDFLRAAGELSSPCFAPTGSVACDTDDSRPASLQKGNTLFAIRDIQLQNPGDAAFQYFGLASPFRVLALNTSWELPLGPSLRLAFDFDVATNLALDNSRVRSRIPVNNLGPCTGGVGTCDEQWEGGGDAYQGQVRIGRPSVKNPQDWQFMLGFRHVESDALMDAFTDSDFHLGGTNTEGYYIGGSWALAQSVTLGARYYSATEVSGPKLSIDLLQVDFGVRF